MSLFIYLQSGHQILHNPVFKNKRDVNIRQTNIAYRCFLQFCQVKLIICQTEICQYLNYYLYKIYTHIHYYIYTRELELTSVLTMFKLGIIIPL